MIYKKTAALISAATKAGALIGGGTEEQIDALAEYGRLIGMAFQIQDDYLDVVSDAEEIGKPVGSDIVKGKMTLMVVHDFQNNLIIKFQTLRGKIFIMVFPKV